MENKDTIIVVGVTRQDEYGNLWVTPAGGGNEVKIGSKRIQLFDLFQQGKAVICHWETYKNTPYIADAKWVEGELPPPVKAEPAQISKEFKPVTRENSIEAQTSFKGFIELCVADKLKIDSPIMVSVIKWGIDKMGLELPSTAPQQQTKPIIPETGKMIPKDEPSTREQQLKIQKMANNKGIVADTKEYISKNFNKDTTKALTKLEADKVIKTLEQENPFGEG